MSTTLPAPVRSPPDPLGRARAVLARWWGDQRAGSSGTPRPAPDRDLRLLPVAAGCWAGAAAGVSGAGWAVPAVTTAAAVLGIVVLVGLLTGRAAPGSGAGPRGASAVHGFQQGMPGRRGSRHPGRSSRPARPPGSTGRTCRWVRFRWPPPAVALAAVLAVSAGLVVGLAHRQALASSPVVSLAQDQAVVTIRVDLTGDAVVRSGGARPAYLLREARVREVEGRGRRWSVRSPVELTVSGSQLDEWRRLPVGTQVRTVARLQPADPGADVAAFARIRGPATVLHGPGPVGAAVERVRAGLRTAVAARSSDQRALVPALVLGDTAAVTDRMRTEFQVTSLTHLMAVSGANLTLLLAFVLIAARWVGVRGWWLRGLALLTVVVFVTLCRSEPSVLRAAAMGVVVLAALGLSSGAGAVRNLALAATVLLLADPWLAVSYGFVLSVLASGGIIWWSPRWSDALGRWCPRLLAEAVSVPLAAHLATLPVIAALSGQVSLVGILANLLAAPAVAPATVFGFAAAGLSLLGPGAAAVAGFGAAWSTQPILWVAEYGSRLPGAAVHWPVTVPALVLLAVIALVAVVLVPVVFSRPWLTVAAALLMLVSVVRPALVPGWPGRSWAVVACDVGQGDGVVVRVDADQAIVFDSGPDPAPMKTCLDQLGVRGVPLLVFTHFHADHVGGFTGVLAGRRVGQIWLSPYPSPPGEAAGVLALARARGIPTRVPAVGEQVDIDTIRLQVFGPVIRPPLSGLIAAEDSSSQQNEESLVVKVITPQLTMLETGDIEPVQQAAVLAASRADGADLRADVLKIPHHGSANQDPEFIAAVGARVAIASAGLHNDYGHPAPRTVRLVENDGMSLLRTDLQGSVAVGRDHGRLVALAQKSGQG